MTRINTNVSSLIAQRNLASANDDLGVRLQRLSTGLKINRGADDPAGLIVSERLRTEITGVSQAVDNIERASNVIATAESSLQEISDLLVSMKSLVIEAANTSSKCLKTTTTTVSFISFRVNGVMEPAVVFH
jgi:flagellin